jgi:hypothetical protein
VSSEFPDKSKTEWKTPLHWTIGSVALSGVLAVVIFPGADQRWVPVLMTISAFCILPEIVKNPGHRRFGNIATTLVCLYVLLQMSPPNNLHPVPMNATPTERHPVIEVSATSVSYNPNNRTVAVVLNFVNLSTFDVETKLHMHLLWGGPHFPAESEMPKETAVDKTVAFGPQPYNFFLMTSYVLPPAQASQWINEKALIMVGAAATYADRDAATEYDFAGNIRLRQKFVDVAVSYWFPRPKSALLF